MIIAQIVRIVYGMKIKDLNDDYIRLAHKGVEGLVLAVVPGAYWVEYLPILKHIPSWVPGTSGRKLAEAYRPTVEDMRNQPFDNVKAALVSMRITLPGARLANTCVPGRRKEKLYRASLPL